MLKQTIQANVRRFQANPDLAAVPIVGRTLRRIRRTAYQTIVTLGNQGGSNRPLAPVTGSPTQEASSRVISGGKGNSFGRSVVPPTGGGCNKIRQLVETWRELKGRLSSEGAIEKRCIWGDLLTPGVNAGEIEANFQRKARLP